MGCAPKLCPETPFRSIAKYLKVTFLPLKIDFVFIKFTLQQSDPVGGESNPGSVRSICQPEFWALKVKDRYVGISVGVGANEKQLTQLESNPQCQICPFF